MKWMLLIAGGGILFLVVLSVVLPPVPVWVGGLIGVGVFLAAGNMAARFME